MLPLIIAAVGAAMAAGSAIGNAATQRQYKKKRDLYLANKEKEIKDDYNNALGDANQSAAAQAATTAADRVYQQGVNTVNGAVTGGSLDRAKMLESVNEARANTASQIAVQGEQQRQQALSTKQSRLDSLDAQKLNANEQDAQNAAQGWNTLGQVGSQLIGAGMGSALQGSSTGSTATAASNVQSQVAAGGQPINATTAANMAAFNANTAQPFTNSLNEQWARNLWNRYTSPSSLGAAGYLKLG